jgi:hypothetical protein
VAYARISITLPRDLLDAADRRARELDRPRSWLLADALRHYLSAPAPAVAPGSGRVGEPATPVDATQDVAEARSRHFAHDLKLAPAERLRRAEELGRLARRVQSRPRRQQIIGFDSYQDFYQWKKARLVGA